MADPKKPRRFQANLRKKFSLKIPKKSICGKCDNPPSESHFQALRELRDAHQADDGGLEEKLEQLPPTFWQKINTQIKMRAPLLCSAFQTHELAVEGLLTTYLNMVGLAAHKGLKKYCKIISASGKVERITGAEPEKKPSLLVRFFNFINARLEDFYGIPNEPGEAGMGGEGQAFDSQNLVFHANKLNLILFPPSEEKVRKVIESEGEEDVKEISVDALQKEFWDGSLNSDKTSETQNESSPKRKRGTRPTYEDYDFQKFLSDKRTLDLRAPYDYNLLNPDVPVDVDDEPVTQPPTKPCTPEPTISSVVQVDYLTTSPPDVIWTPQFKALIFMPLALLFLLLMVGIACAVAAKRKQREYDAPPEEEKRSLKIFLESTETEEEEEGPALLVERGERKTREQAHKDDFVPIGPKKKRKYFRRSKK